MAGSAATGADASRGSGKLARLGADLAPNLGIGVGSGVAGGIAGTVVSWVPCWILLAAGQDYASVGSAVARVLVAAGFIAAGVTLANLDALPLKIGAGVVVGAAAGALFGPAGVDGLGGFVLAFRFGVIAGAFAGLAGVLLGLTQIPTLLRRELGAFFFSPIAYVVATVFLFLFGIFTYFGLIVRDAEASLWQPMRVSTVLFLPVIAPILTMRLFSEEKRSGTIEVLMTAPVRDWEVVAAKFMAALTTFGMMLVPTLAHVLVLYLVSEKGPATAPLVGGYLGVTLTGALFMSLGLLASSLSRDQIVAAILGFAFSFCLFLVSFMGWIASALGWFAENPSAVGLFRAVSFVAHLEGFLQGMIDTRGMMYFVSLTAFVLFLTVRVVESRKWR